MEMTKIRDWSLITGRGATKRKGGGGWHMMFYPYEKGGGGGGVLAILKGGTSFWVVFTR